MQSINLCIRIDNFLTFIYRRMQKCKNYVQSVAKVGYQVLITHFV